MLAIHRAPAPRDHALSLTNHCEISMLANIRRVRTGCQRLAAEGLDGNIRAPKREAELYSEGEICRMTNFTFWAYSSLGLYVARISSRSLSR